MKRTQGGSSRFIKSQIKTKNNYNKSGARRGGSHPSENENYEVELIKESIREKKRALSALLCASKCSNGTGQ